MNTAINLPENNYNTFFSEKLIKQDNSGRCVSKLIN